MIKSNKIPRSWDQLVRLKKFLSYADGKKLRLPEDELYYRLHLKLVPKKVLVEIIKRQINGRSICLLKNNHPYTRILKYLPEVEHYCLWSKKGRLSETKINKYLNRVLKKRKSWFFMERLENAKSIPEIWHCHVFLKR